MILESQTESKEVIIASTFLRYLMQFRTRKLDVYKDSLLEQTVASERVEVVSPESSWVE